MRVMDSSLVVRRAIDAFNARRLPELLAPAPHPVTPEAGGEYFCPMDPEVVSDHPGACPKCGMALERRMLTAADAASAADPELRAMTWRLWLCAALTAPLMLLAMSGVTSAALLGGRDAQWRGWVELMLATPVVIWGAAPFFKRGAQVCSRSVGRE